MKKNKKDNIIWILPPLFIFLVLLMLGMCTPKINNRYIIENTKTENFPKEKFIEKVRNLDSEEKNRVFKAIKWHMDTYKSYFVRFDTEEIYTGNEVLEVFERLLEGVSK